MDDKKKFSKTFSAQKRRKGLSSNVSNKDQLNFEYDTEVDLDRCSMWHQDEKNQILEKSAENIKLMEDENDIFKIKTQDQADKIKQLD